MKACKPVAIFGWLACEASVSVRFRSKERGTRVKNRAKNGASKRVGEGVGKIGRKHWRVNLADKNKQQPQEDTSHVPYMTYQYETNLWSTHVNIVRLAEPIRRYVRWWTQVFKFAGLVCKRFLPSFAHPPPPPPTSFNLLFSRGQNRKSCSSVFFCSETKLNLNPWGVC